MKTLRIKTNFFLILFCSILLISCDYLQLLKEPEFQKSLADSLKIQNDSLVKLTQQQQLEKNKIQDARSIYSKYAGSTVTVVTKNGLGSGFYISKNIIVTNYHVVKDASEVGIVIKDHSELVSVLGYVALNKMVDLVLLKTDVIGQPIPISNVPLNVGDKIFVIGSPIGLTTTLSEGIVSSKRSSEDHYFIQITAPISPGSSGGPVINETGEVVGVSVMQFREGQNLNFAIPAPEINILAAFQSDYARSFSDLAQSSRRIQFNTSTSEYDSQIEESENDEWNEKNRNEFIQFCISKYDPQNENASSFEFCDCLYQKISNAYTPKSIRNISNEILKDYMNDCNAQITE